MCMCVCLGVHMYGQKSPCPNKAPFWEILGKMQAGIGGQIGHSLVGSHRKGAGSFLLGLFLQGSADLLLRWLAGPSSVERNKGLASLLVCGQEAMWSRRENLAMGSGGPA